MRREHSIASMLQRPLLAVQDADLAQMWRKKSQQRKKKVFPYDTFLSNCTIYKNPPH